MQEQLTNISCNKCKNKIKYMSGLAFSPPIDNTVVKYHICLDCWIKFKIWLNKKDN